MPVGQFDAKHGVRQNCNYLAFNLYPLFLGHS
jgi:hypothetical protein